MMVAFFSIFPFCGLIVGWIILLLYTHFVRKKNDTSDRWIEINHFQRGYFLLYTMLLIIIKGNFDKNVRAAIFVSVISVLNLLVYLLFLIANGFAMARKRRRVRCQNGKRRVNA